MYKDKRGDDFPPYFTIFNAWHLISGKINWVACRYSKATLLPGTALFGAMAVLAMLKALKPRFLHLHAPAQYIMPPPAAQVSAWLKTGSG